MPKPGPVVCAEAWSRSEARPPVACRSPARSCAPKPCRRSRSEARPGAGNCPARSGAGTETGKSDSTTVEITCACRRMTDRPRRFANFWKQIEKNGYVRSVSGGSVLRIEKNGKFDAPVGLLGRVSRTGSNYDSLEETQWPCASFGQLSEKRGKRLSPIRLRGISSENREKRQSSTRRSVFSGVCRARGVTTTLSRKPNGRARHFANFRKIEENDKVRSVYGGSVGETRISVSTCFNKVPCRAVPCRAVPTGG